MALAKEWTDHIKEPEKKNEFAQYVRNSSHLLDRLTEIIDLRLRAMQAQEDKDDFSSPSWAMQMAARQGRRKALNEIRKLLDRG